MPRDHQIIVPDLYDADHDRTERENTHYDLFGHYPPKDPRDRCEHPIHATIRRAMNDGEVTIDFDASDVVSEDSVENALGKARYDHVFSETQDWQKSVEERESHRKARELGIVIPGRNR